MRRFLFVLLAAVCLSVNAHEKEGITTLYRYGKPLATCGTNFENLFDNFHKYVNDDGHLKFLSSKYVGTVEDAKQAHELVKKNFEHYPGWSWEWGMTRTSEGEVRHSEFNLHSMYASVKRTDKEAVNTIANELVRPGDHIYLLRFVYKTETFEQYVFVHPDTKEVVTEGNAFGFGVQLAHIEYCNGLRGKRNLSTEAEAVTAANTRTSRPDGWLVCLEAMKMGWAPNDWEGDLRKLTLVDYELKGKIDTEEERSEVVDAMFADESPLASVLSDVVMVDTVFTDKEMVVEERTYPKFEIFTIRQLIDSGELSEAYVSTLKQQMKENIQLGTERLELVWKYKGKEYRVAGVVANGAPFDSLSMGLGTSKSTHKSSL